MRLFTKRMKKFNQLGGTGGEAIRILNLGGTAAITVGTATITTAGITTANVTTISGVTADINNVRADVSLVLPVSAYTGTKMTEGAIYTTGGRILIGRGNAWKSGFTFAESTITKLSVGTKLVVPVTAYTGQKATYGAVYATGAYLYWSNGVAWKSGAGGFG